MWTIVPEEILWEGFAEETSSYVELTNSAGILLQVEPLDGNTGRIVRVISSEPNDYFRPDCQPGTVVDLASGCPIEER